MTTFKRLLVLTLMLAGLGACDPTDRDPMNASSTADGGTDAGPSLSPEAQAFVGQWNYVSGTESAQCGSAPADTQAVTAADGTVTFSAGSGPNQLVVDDAGCIVPVTVSGTIATGQPGTVCPGNFTTSSLVYTLSSGTLREQGNGQIEENGQYCTVSDDAYLTRN
jgi:hypothetical protein